MQATDVISPRSIRKRILFRPAPSARWFVMLCSLLTGALIASSLSVLEKLWWPETFRVAYLALAVSVLVEMLPLHRAYRILLLLAGTLTVVFTAAPIEWQPYDPILSDSRLGHLIDNLAGLHPFVEIALAIALIHTLFSAWARTRSRIIGFSSVALLLLAVADSFTPIVLWDKTAIAILAGLLWLVSEHFARFQQEHPTSWAKMLNYPIQLLLPIVLVLSLVMATGVLVPEIPPVIKDPYTIWRESKGETVRAFVGDKGIAPSGSSKQSNKSGYSRGDDKLGGAFNFDYSPVMTVKSDRKSYWRGETKSTYTGKGWEDGPREKDELFRSTLKTGEQLPLAWDRPQAETVKITQEFKLARKDDVFPVLFGAASIDSVTSVTLPNKNVDYTGIPAQLSWGAASMELRFETGQASYPSSYSLESQQTLLDDGLKSAAAVMPNEMEQATYTQRPMNIPARVTQLGRQLTEGQSSDYGKAAAIEEYLKTSFPYTNEPDLTKKVSSDFVDSFLFEIQEGYCDYFSSAMVVLARSVDLPARWVKGYAPGSNRISTAGGGRVGPEDFVEGDVYTVRNSDAHSWVEIYFDGYGWIPFEPTAGFAYPYPSATDDSAVPTPTPAPSMAPDEDTVVKDESGGLSLPPYVSAIILIVLALSLAVTGYRKRQWIADAWQRMRVRSLSAEERISWDTGRMLRSAKRGGLVKGDHETLREAIVRWSKERRFLKPELSGILADFEKAKYGGKPVSQEQAEAYAVKVQGVLGRFGKPG